MRARRKHVTSPFAGDLDVETHRRVGAVVAQQFTNATVDIDSMYQRQFRGYIAIYVLKLNFPPSQGLIHAFI